MNSIDQSTLSSLAVGEKGKVVSLKDNDLKRRFLDLGIIPGTIIKAERYSPSGNPIAFNIRGTIIAIRKDDANDICVNII